MGPFVVFSIMNKSATSRQDRVLFFDGARLKIRQMTDFYRETGLPVAPYECARLENYNANY
jgi:hypothetical protein